MAYNDILHNHENCWEVGHRDIIQYQTQVHKINP